MPHEQSEKAHDRSVTNRQVHDLRRLAAVQRSRLLDTPPDEPFDRLATLARDLLNARVALVTVVDSRRSYWKARIGVDQLPGERRLAGAGWPRQAEDAAAAAVDEGPCAGERFCMHGC